MNKKVNDLRVLVLEHDTTYLEFLRKSLDEFGIQEYYLTKNHQQANSCYYTHFPDVCLFGLEPNGTGMNGLDLAKTIRQQHSSVPIIFLTTAITQQEQQAVQALLPSSLLQKTASRSALSKALSVATAQLKSNALKEAHSNTDGFSLEKWPPIDSSNRIFFKIGDVYKAFQLTEILYFHADNKLNYARIDNRNFPTSLQLKVLEDELHPNFLRCHKKYLINTAKIDSIHIKEDKIKVGNDLLPIGYGYKRDFLEKLRLLK